MRVGLLALGLLLVGLAAAPAQAGSGWQSYRAGSGDVFLPCTADYSPFDDVLDPTVQKLDGYGGRCFGTGGFIRSFGARLVDDTGFRVAGKLESRVGCCIVLTQVEFCEAGEISVPREATKIAVYVYEVKAELCGDEGLPATTGKILFTYAPG